MLETQRRSFLRVEAPESGSFSERVYLEKYILFFREKPQVFRLTFMRKVVS
jgi:hypothetical protein